MYDREKGKELSEFTVVNITLGYLHITRVIFETRLISRIIKLFLSCAVKFGKSGLRLLLLDSLCGRRAPQANSHPPH